MQQVDNWTGKLPSGGGMLISALEKLKPKYLFPISIGRIRLRKRSPNTRSVIKENLQSPLMPLLLFFLPQILWIANCVSLLMIPKMNR